MLPAGRCLSRHLPKPMSPRWFQFPGSLPNAQPGVNNSVSVIQGTNTLTFTDPNETITAAPAGWQLSNTNHTATGPLPTGQQLVRVVTYYGDDTVDAHTVTSFPVEIFGGCGASGAAGLSDIVDRNAWWGDKGQPVGRGCSRAASSQTNESSWEQSGFPVARLLAGHRPSPFGAVSS
jgi:hypothetical protein